MKKSVLLPLILVSLHCQAQFKDFSFRAAATFPLIASTNENVELNMVPISAAAGYNAVVVRTGTVRQSFQGKVGFDLSGRFNYGIAKRFFLSSGISATCIRFRRTVEVESLNEISQPTIPLFPTIPGGSAGTPFGTIIPVDANGEVINHTELKSASPDLGNTTTWNIQVPLMAGTSLFKEKVLIKAGPVFSYLVYASEIKQQYNMQTTTMSVYKDVDKQGFNDILASGMLETTFRATSRLGIDFSAQHFFTPVYANEGQSGSGARCNNFLIGVSYQL